MTIDWAAVQHNLLQMGLLHLGFVTVALAYLVRDVFYLRLLAVLGYGFFIGESLRQGMPNTALLGWYALFLVANAGHAWHLAVERRRDHLTADERRLADLAFPGLSAAAARRLMRQGHWRDLEPGTVLLSEGHVGSRVYALAEGMVDVVVDGEVVAAAQPGQLVGEVGFLAGGPATATAVAREKLRALVWDRSSLERGMRRAPDLHDAVYAAFGSDLARKVADQTLRPRRVAASAGA